MPDTIQWNSLPLLRSSAACRDQARLLASVEAFAKGSPDPDVPETLEKALRYLDQLAPLLTARLLTGDTFTLESELLILIALPSGTPEVQLFAGASRTHLHLLRYRPSRTGSGRMEQWIAPVKGHPVGLTLQTVGYLDAFEVVLLSCEGSTLHEVRLDVSDPMRVAVMRNRRTEAALITSLGTSVSHRPSTFQIEVRLASRPDERPCYELRARLNAVAPWHLVHTAPHPLQNPVDDGRTLYFTARGNQIRAITDPVGVNRSAPRTVIALETPSPINALLRHPTDEGLVLLAATADGSLFAIDASSGRVLWKYDASQSLTTATFNHSSSLTSLAIATPDGLFSVLHPVQTAKVNAQIQTLLALIRRPLDLLLSKLPGPQALESAPAKDKDLPFLRLVIIDQMLTREHLSVAELEQVKNSMLQAFSSPNLELGLTQAAVVRFLGVQFAKVVGLLRERTEGLPQDEPRLAMLFAVLSGVASQAHGDARRRLERLLRRLREEWLGVPLFEHYRGGKPDAISHQSISTFSFRHLAQTELRMAQESSAYDDRAKHLLHALTATWRLYASPLNRTTSLQGVSHAVKIFSRHPDHDAPPGSDAIRLAGLVRNGIQIFRLHPEQEVPESKAFYPVEGGTRLAASPLYDALTDVLAVATADAVRLFSLRLDGDGTRIEPIPAADLELDEPATSLEFLRLPTDEGDSSDLLCLAVGQADGRVRLFGLTPPREERLREVTALYHAAPVLDLFRPTPIHHVALEKWPEQSTLIISADPVLCLCTDIRVVDGKARWNLDTLELESAATAFTVAWPVPRTGSITRPILVVGLANGLVQAFQPSTTPDAPPELCWTYHAPQGITQVTYIPDAAGGWFVAASDSGTLSLLRNGELHHQVTVERYPIDLSLLRFPNNESLYLLVSSPAGAVTLLETTAADPRPETAPLVERLTRTLPVRTLLLWLERSSDRVHRSLAAFILRDHGTEELLRFAEQHFPQALIDKEFARTLLNALLYRMAQDGGNRARAWEFVRRLLSDANSPSSTRVQLLHAIGEQLDRIEDTEIDLLMGPGRLDDPALVRAYVKMLEHLWFRFHQKVESDFVWWRSLSRLASATDPFIQRRHLLPLIGPFVRKLLEPNRDNLIARMRALRDLEDRGVFITQFVCESLSLPHMTSDLALQRYLVQYSELLRARSVTEIQQALANRRDLLDNLAQVLPGALEAKRVIDEILLAFSFTDYDQYNRFLVNSQEFLPGLRGLESGDDSLLSAFEEVRGKLQAALPPSPVRQETSHYQQLVQVLLAHSEILLSYHKWWSDDPVLERRLAAAIFTVWRQNILRPEISRLHESVHLSLSMVKVLVTEDKGFAEVSAHIHNQGGYSLKGLLVSLEVQPSDPYMWDGSSEWCEGPINFGQSITYRTGILLEDQTDELTLRFEVRTNELKSNQVQILNAKVRVEREARVEPLAGASKWSEEAPIMFEALFRSLVHLEPGRLLLLMGEESREREQLLQELASSLSDEARGGHRLVLQLDLQSMLEGPSRADADPLPPWWLPYKLSQALGEGRALVLPPKRDDLHLDPRRCQDQFLHQALESFDEIFVLFKRVHLVLMTRTADTLRTAFTWLRWLLEHSAHRLRFVAPVDFSSAARLFFSQPSISSRFGVINVDQPYPAEHARAKDEHLRRIRRLLEEVKLFPSDLILHKLVAHAGWNLPLMKRLINRLEAHRADAWLTFKMQDKEGPGEPEELDRFLSSALNAISRSFKGNLRALPPFHRLMLATLASAEVQVSRKELRQSLVLANEVSTLVKARANRAKRLFAANAVLLEGDVAYLKITVGDLQGTIKVALFRSLDFSMALSHLLAVVSVPALLEHLVALDLVRKTVLQSETVYAFPIPLFRRWLEATHPVHAGEEGNLRRRLLEDGAIAEAIDLSTYVEVHRRLRLRGQLRDFLIFLGLLESDPSSGASNDPEAGLPKWERLLGIARRAQAWYLAATQGNLELLVHEWASMFDGRLIQQEVPQRFELPCVVVDLTPLRIPRLARAVVFGLEGEPDVRTLQRMREMLNELDIVRQRLEEDGSQSLGFILLHRQVGLSDFADSSFAAFSAYGDRLLPLTERDLVRTTLHEQGRSALLEHLAASGYKFQHLSPYQLKGPLRGHAINVLFVGREGEIDDVIRHPDKHFAFVGSRRIGKTSLLLKLKQDLTRHLGERARVVYLDCTNHTPAQVWRELAQGLKLEAEEPEAVRHRLKTHLQTARHPVVILLDELDGIYEGPKPAAQVAAERFVWDLRSLSTDGPIRVILAGFSTIHELRFDQKSAFYNFTNFCRLGALSREAAGHLVRSPLASLDIGMASEGLVDLIIDRTYRVPWIIQLFCHQLIHRLDERLAKNERHAFSRKGLDRRILSEDVSGVSVEVHQELYTHFTSPKIVTPEQEIMLLTMVEAEVHQFRTEDLRLMLETRFGDDVWNVLDYDDVSRQLDNLTLTLALNEESGVFFFPLNMYPHVMKSQQGDVRAKLDRLYRETVRRERGQ